MIKDKDTLEYFILNIIICIVIVWIVFMLDSFNKKPAIKEYNPCVNYSDTVRNNVECAFLYLQEGKNEKACDFFNKASEIDQELFDSVLGNSQDWCF